MLVVSLVLHIVAAVQLIRIDRAARPVAYAKHETQAATLASRTMRWGGLVIGIFIVLHLLHFTTGTLRPAPYVAGDVYGNVVGSFVVPWVSALYIVAMIAVGLHLVSRLVERVPHTGCRAGVGASACTSHLARGRVHSLARVHDRAGGRAAGVGAMSVDLNARIPAGPIDAKWDQHRFEMKLVNPANKRRTR